jgi:hypothetical protein
MNKNIIAISVIIIIVTSALVVTYMGSLSYPFKEENPEYVNGEPNPDYPHSDIPDLFIMYFDIEPSYLIFRFKNVRGKNSELQIQRVIVNDMIVKEHLPSQDRIELEYHYSGKGEISISPNSLTLLSGGNPKVLSNWLELSELTVQIDTNNGSYKWIISPPYPKQELESSEAYIKESLTT